MDKNQFKKLQKTWYLRLKESGFEDIENESGSLKKFNLPRTHMTSSAHDSDGETYGSGRVHERFLREQARQLNNTHYYDICCALRHTKRFKEMSCSNLHHRKIWDMHCEGSTYDKIAKKFKMHPSGIKWVINKYRALLKE